LVRVGQIPEDQTRRPDRKACANMGGHRHRRSWHACMEPGQEGLLYGAARTSCRATTGAIGSALVFHLPTCSRQAAMKNSTAKTGDWVTIDENGDFC